MRSRTAFVLGLGLVAAAVVVPAAPRAAATATPVIVARPSKSVPAGGTISESARLTGDATATGTVTFSLFGWTDHGCTGTPLLTRTHPYLNGKASSGKEGVYAAGTYHWIAAYSGDANNAAVTSTCSEPVTVSKASPTLATTPSGPGTLGGRLSEYAQLSGDALAGGWVTFALYGPLRPTCSGPPLIIRNRRYSAAGVTSGPLRTKRSGTYHWVVTYSGDANNNAVVALCGDPVVVT